MSRYRAVIFDFGGVISTSPLTAMRRYCEQAGVSWETIRLVLAAENGAWERYETNSISAAEFVHDFQAEAEKLAVSIDAAAFLKGYLAGMLVRPEMVAVVKQLRSLPDLRVGCITNNHPSEGGRRNPLFDELFEIVVESSVVGLRKPDPRIYQHACELLAVRPEEAIFLDDFGINLKAARSLGMATIKVDETGSAIDELQQLLAVDLPHAAVPATEG